MFPINSSYTFSNLTKAKGKAKVKAKAKNNNLKKYKSIKNLNIGNISNNKIFKKINHGGYAKLEKKNKHVNNKKNDAKCDGCEGNTEMMNEIYELLKV